MTAINSSEQACRKLLYDLNGISTDNTPVNPFATLPMEIALGTPLFVGAPILAKNLKLDKPYSVWKEMQSKPGMKWGQAWDIVSSRRNFEKNALKEATKHLKDNNSLWQTMKNKHQYSNLKHTSAYISKHADYFEEAKNLIKEAEDKKLTGKELKAQMKKIRQAVAKGHARVNTAIANGTIPAKGRLGKLKHGIKTKTGYYKLKGKLLESPKYGARASSGMRLAAKGVKGSGVMAVIQGLLELPDVIDAYKINAKTGNKQLAKSATKVGTSVLGYAAGAAAAGAIAGTVVPGIGNAAGAIVGFVGGLIGGAIASWGVGKIWDSANGKGSFDKTEAQIAMAEQADEKAKELSKTPEGMQKLLSEANQNLVDENGNYLGDEESLKAYKSLVNQMEQSIAQAQTVQQQNDEFINQLLNLGYVA